MTVHRYTKNKQWIEQIYEIGRSITSIGPQIDQWIILGTMEQVMMKNISWSMSKQRKKGRKFTNIFNVKSVDLILRFNLQTGETDPIYRFKNQKAGIDSIRAMQKIGDYLIVSRYCDYMVWDSLTKRVHYHYDQMVSHIRGFCLLDKGIIIKDGGFGKMI